MATTPKPRLTAESYFEQGHSLDEHVCQHQAHAASALFQIPLEDSISQRMSTNIELSQFAECVPTFPVMHWW
jgi:hypothetical protein